MESWIKASLSALTRSAGFELIPTWRIQHLSFELFLRDLFSMYSIDLVIDVGANLGQYHDFVRYQVGYQGWIVSFEPDPDCVLRLLERSRSDDKWHIEPVALGCQRGLLDLHVTADSHFNSFLHPAKDGLVAKQFEVKSKIINKSTVQVRTLEDYEPLFAELIVSRPYLKLDTQGFDLEVLMGATNFLPKIRALQTEASVRAIYDGMPDYQETLDYLSKSGFALSHTFPVCHDHALRLIEFDCVAVNSSFADLVP